MTTADPLQGLTAADQALLGQLLPVLDDMRSSACLLARMGVYWRRRDPDRCARWLEILETHPFYKLGQVMFDLLEWEDYMLDGEPPAIEPELVRSLVNRMLRQAGYRIDAFSPPTDLPALETGFYLYRDVVLGVLWAALEGSGSVITDGGIHPMATVSIRPTDSRYLGNTSSTEVHDLDNEMSRCQIDKILQAQHAVVFSPDSLTEAHERGYDNCAHCIGDSTR